MLASGAVYIPGVKQRIAVRVEDPDQQRWGFQLTARLNSDLVKGQAGEFTPIDTFTQVICEDNGPQPCAPGPQFIEHTSVGTRRGTTGGATFQFDWTPPATNVGKVTFYLAGNAANGNDQSTGDRIYTASMELSPLTPSAPSVTAGGIVNGATGGADPIGANTWVTVYGSNLGVTTRSWTDSDFTNGAMPVSLDGVSVVMTSFGAPRLAYVGYVSPTQVNFVMPSDMTPTTIQVQVRNPAGITTTQNLTVAANAPQLLTVDGKHVWATHSNGKNVDSTAPATPGETLILYGTGLGPTNPAQIPGQIPTDAASLVNPPTVTCGGSSAKVISAGILPGTAGVYQLNVQVPSDAANGDQQVVAQIGTANSVPVMIPVQK